MKYKVGDRVRCIVPAFIKLFAGHNIWVIDHIKTQTKGYPSLYVAYREDDKNKMLYQFLESEVVYEERNLGLSRL